MNLFTLDPMALIVSVFMFVQPGGGAEGGATTNSETLVLITSLYVFALAAFLGYQLISRVPPLLHTPLMSATNAISGISLIGSLVIAGSKYDHHQTLASILGGAAVTSAMINVTGGFLITDRMLKMFRKKETPQKGAHGAEGKK